MEIVYDLITEDHLTHWNPDIFGTLCNLLDDTLALKFRRYFESTEANPEIQAMCRQYMGKTVESYTFHIVVQEMDLINLVREITPETILLTSEEYRADVKEKLQFIKDNYDKLRANIPARKRTDWLEFSDMMAHMPYATVEYMKNLSVNKAIFFGSHEVDRALPTRYLIKAKDKWMMALNAIKWGEYCKQNQMPYSLDGRLRFL